MVRLSATTARGLLCTTLAVVSAACFDTSTSIPTLEYPTRLTVDPLSFRGSLRCGAPGLEQYVATLTNVTANAPPDKLVTSSGPVACNNLVSFGDSFILSSNFYVATIDGYDRDVIPDPSGAVMAGQRPQMVDKSSGEPIAPRWTTTCGEVPTAAPAGDADVPEDAAPPYNPLRFPTLALGKSEVIVHGCLPLAAIATPDASTDAPISDADVPADASTDTSDVADVDGGPGDDAGETEGGFGTPRRP